MTLGQWDWAAVGVGLLLMLLICGAILALTRVIFRERKGK